MIEGTTRVPITYRGTKVGEALVDEDWEIIHSELDTGAFPDELKALFRFGMADSLSIKPNLIPAVPQMRHPNHNQ